MTRSDRTSTHIQLPVEVRQAMKDEDDPMWRIVAEAVRTYLGLDGDSLAAMTHRVERIDQQISTIEDEIEDLEAERDELVIRRENLEDQIERLHENRREYSEIIDGIISELASDNSLKIDSQLHDLKEAAVIRNDGVAADDVVEEVREDVRTRVAEQDVDVAEWQLYSDPTPENTGALEEPSRPGLQSLQMEETND